MMMLGGLEGVQRAKEYPRPRPIIAGPLIIAFDRRARKVLRCYRFSAASSMRARTSRRICSNSDDLSDTRRRRVRASAISSTPASAFDLLQMRRRPALGAGRSAPLGTRRRGSALGSSRRAAFLCNACVFTGGPSNPHVSTKNDAGPLYAHRSPAGRPRAPGPSEA